MLDIIARDKRGRPVNDLKAGELEVYEDGVKQQIGSFRLIGPQSADSPSSGADVAGRPPAPVDPLRQINLVTMIFERLNNEARLLARDAAMEFLKNELHQNVRVSIFVLDQRMRVLQQFTNERERLRQAIDRATGGASSQFADQSEAIRRELEKMVNAQAAITSASADAQSTGGAGIGQAAVEAKLAEITANTLRMADDSQREQQGASSIYSLLSLVSEQRRLAGRKTVLYFSEGLQLTPSLTEVFRTMIGIANRSNVSFYSIDARGLQTSRQTGAARESLDAAAQASQQQLRSRGGQAVTREQAMVFDNAESSILKNTQGNLADLAESTGGFLVANTNDIRTPMKRVATELASYYEVSYIPTIRAYDGKFRQIKVVTSRPDIILQTRSGYFALPPNDAGAPQVIGFELPLLAALSSAKLPRDFEYRATTMHFESKVEGTHHSLLMEVPLANLTINADKENKIYRTHFALMALIKNAAGRVVQKFSQDYPLEGPVDKLEALKRGNVVFIRNFWLPPGRYTLETVAHDREIDKLSARRSILMVPTIKEGVRMSSLAVIKRIDPVDPNVKDPDNPMRFPEGKIIPNLDDEILPNQTAQLSFYFIVYPASGVTERPTLALEFLLDGEVIARATPDLSQPDAQGWIPYIASVPMNQFKTGRYELRAVVQQGQLAVEEHAFFTIGGAEGK